MKKCEECLNRVPVISENGLHYNCGLNEDHAMECISGVKDHNIIANPGWVHTYILCPKCNRATEFELRRCSFCGTKFEKEKLDGPDRKTT